MLAPEFSCIPSIHISSFLTSSFFSACSPIACTITFNSGGPMWTFTRKFKWTNRRGETFHLDELCVHILWFSLPRPRSLSLSYALHSLLYFRRGRLWLHDRVQFYGGSVTLECILHSHFYRHTLSLSFLFFFSIHMYVYIYIFLSLPSLFFPRRHTHTRAWGARGFVISHPASKPKA